MEDSDSKPDPEELSAGGKIRNSGGANLAVKNADDIVTSKAPDATLKETSTMSNPRCPSLAWTLAAVVVAWVLAVPAAQAQNPTGELTGRVTDPDGGAPTAGVLFCRAIQ